MPADGIPQKPEAWLLRVAKNRIVDAARRRQVHHDSEKTLAHAAEEAQEAASTHDEFPDERLKLLFVCAHPAIDPAARTPLMLQTVLGLDAARIASAFLVSPQQWRNAWSGRRQEFEKRRFPFVCRKNRNGTSESRSFSMQSTRHTQPDGRALRKSDQLITLLQPMQLHLAEPSFDSSRTNRKLTACWL